MRAISSLLLFFFFLCPTFGQGSNTNDNGVFDFENLLNERLQKKSDRNTANMLGKKLPLPSGLKIGFEIWGKTNEMLKSTLVLFVSKAKSKVRLYICKKATGIQPKMQNQAVLNQVIRPQIDMENCHVAIRQGVKTVLKFY